MAILEPRLMIYSLARHLIQDADVLLFAATSMLGKMIGQHSHAAMSAWNRGLYGTKDRLVCMDTCQWHGGRAMALSNVVARYPGIIDVYRPPLTTDNQRRAAVLAMFDMTGREYGWGSLLKAAVTHTRIFGRVFPPSKDDALNGSLPFCSQAVSKALRLAGYDPRPNLADGFTEPGHLADALAENYLFTLI